MVPVPDSGVPAAIGFSQASGIKFELGLIRNHYVGRTFIEPTQTIRSLGVKLKLSSTKSIIKDKSLILIDDSWSEELLVVRLLKCFTKLGLKRCMSGLLAQR